MVIALLYAEPNVVSSGADFFQLWLGARAVLTGESPYGAHIQQEMLRVYGSTWGGHGLPYPLPILIAMTPFGLFAPTVSMWPWLGLCLMGIAGVVLLQPPARQRWLIPLLFLPLLRTIVLMQPTLMYVALAV
ncbi:MAG TPA: hypothetical protein VLA19_27735, partial [Herpetosiphonaceae bacterium]|nr:hypothetical protein [Herpetosiphonaceae bacterium]